MPSVKRVFGNKRGRGTILVSALLLLTIFITIFTVTPNNVSAIATSPPLGAASTFAVLGAVGVSENTLGSAIKGDVGNPSGTSITGITCAEVTGNIYESDAGSTLPCAITNAALLTSAYNYVVAAYGALDQPCDVTYPGTPDLAGSNLVAGVYCAPAGGFALSGTLTLVGSGVWIFKSSSGLTTTTTGNVVGGDPCNVWWRVPSSATLGSGTELTGNILALASITLNTGATLNGKALVQTGAVTLNDNKVTTSNCALVTTVTTTIVSTITTVISGTTTTIVTTIITPIVLLLPPTPKAVVAPVAVGGVMLPSVGLTVLLPWAIALSMIGVLSVEAFRVKRRAKQR